MTANCRLALRNEAQQGQHVGLRGARPARPGPTYKNRILGQPPSSPRPTCIPSATKRGRSDVDGWITASPLDRRRPVRRRPVDARPPLSGHLSWPTPNTWRSEKYRRPSQDGRSRWECFHNLSQRLKAPTKQALVIAGSADTRPDKRGRRPPDSKGSGRCNQIVLLFQPGVDSAGSAGSGTAISSDFGQRVSLCPKLY